MTAEAPTGLKARARKAAACLASGPGGFRLAAGGGLAAASFAAGAPLWAALLALGPGLGGCLLACREGSRARERRLWPLLAGIQATLGAALAAAFGGEWAAVTTLWTTLPLLEPDLEGAEGPDGAFATLCLAPPVLSPVLVAAAGGPVGWGLSAAAFSAMVFWSALMGRARLRRLRERSEAAESAARFVDVHSDRALLRLDADGRVKGAHGPCLGLLGRAPATLTGRPIEELFAAEDAHALKKALSEALYGGARQRLRLEPAGRPDGLIDIALTPLGAPAPGAGFECLALLRDGREERERDRMMQEASERAHLAQIAKSRLLAHMSHEFRTPLNAILGFSELIQRQTPASAPSPELEQALSSAVAIHEGGRRLLRLVEDLLAVAQDDPVPAARLGPVAVDRLAAERLEAAAPEAQRRGVALTKGDLAPLIARADAGSLAQALDALLAQAVAVSAPGASARLSVAAQEGAARLVLEDEGVGMSQEMLLRVRDPLLRAERCAHVDSDFGATLRLAGALHLIEAMGGTLELDSAPHRGTRAIILLPLAQGARASGAA